MEYFYIKLSVYTFSYLEWTENTDLLERMNYVIKILFILDGYILCDVSLKIDMLENHLIYGSKYKKAKEIKC